MRLNRFLASAGLGSRRGVEELILSGRVKVNGRVVDDLATQVAPDDVVKLGNRVVRAEHTLTAMMYKPRGIVCTADDERERRTIFDFFPKSWPRVFHVGRLDKESEGLLLVTNDGDLSLALTHPSHRIDKEYEVWLDKPFDAEHREKLLRGFKIEGGRAKAEHVTIVKPQLLKIILRQGIKRQIRQMFFEVGYEVMQLRRIRIGALRLGDLKPGECRILTSNEITTLKSRSAEPPARKPTASTTAKKAPRRRPISPRSNQSV